MLNYLWAAMIAIGIIYAAFTGNLEAITNAALDSAGEGISLCITTAGVMALWMGLMEIAQQAGLVARLTKGIEPLLSFLFPGIPKRHKAREYIATNIIANVLGLGWACTPAGLKAMEELARLERERGNPEYLEDEVKNGNATPKKSVGGRTASREMCTFLILNISSLQLIPVNMIAYRSQYGSTRAAVIYCKCRDRRRHFTAYSGGERRAA